MNTSFSASQSSSTALNQPCNEEVLPSETDSEHHHHHHGEQLAPEVEFTATLNPKSAHSFATDARYILTTAFVMTPHAVPMTIASAFDTENPGGPEADFPSHQQILAKQLSWCVDRSLRSRRDAVAELKNGVSGDHFADMLENISEARKFWIRLVSEEDFARLEGFNKDLLHFAKTGDSLDTSDEDVADNTVHASDAHLSPTIDCPHQGFSEDPVQTESRHSPSDIPTLACGIEYHSHTSNIGCNHGHHNHGHHELAPPITYFDSAPFSRPSPGSLSPKEEAKADSIFWYTPISGKDGVCKSAVSLLGYLVDLPPEMNAQQVNADMDDMAEKASIVVSSFIKSLYDKNVEQSEHPEKVLTRYEWYCINRDQLQTEVTAVLEANSISGVSIRLLDNKDYQYTVPWGRKQMRGIDAHWDQMNPEEGL